MNITKVFKKIIMRLVTEGVISDAHTACLKKYMTQITNFLKIRDSKF